MKAEYLQMFLFDIPAFRMRDIDFRFGSDITPLELKENEILLELKPYLQPFEKILALAELKPYLNHDTKIDFFKDEAEEKFLINTKASCRNLLNRLTYWERVGKKTLQPTTQVLYEYTQDCYLKGVNNNKLHRKRRLRYGPHDIHEYRGKFFPQLVRSFINFAGLEPGD
ncbi:MAG: hypothetical protein GTO02_01460, partial [Candidatus Dadabacteria bacterium]|nr:hypothetical protein [Candidatus Dadabacteria bacterium]